MTNKFLTDAVNCLTFNVKDKVKNGWVHSKLPDDDENFCDMYNRKRGREAASIETETSFLRGDDE